MSAATIPNYGCFSDEANQDIDEMIDVLIDKIEDGELTTPERLVAEMAMRMSEIGDGACDTVVKETVAYHLRDAMEEHNIPEFGMLLYGW